MGESQWWLYDLVVIAIAVLCIWNGAGRGILRSGGSLLIGIVSCLVSAFLSETISEMIYDNFVQDMMQSTITKRLSNADLSGNIRRELESRGIYLPYDDAQIADMIDDIQDENYVQQAALIFGIDKDQLEEMISESLDQAIEINDNILPEFVADSVDRSSKKISLESVADTAAAILRNDYSGASLEIEKNYIKPVVMGILKTLIFILITVLLSSLLRLSLLVLPSRKESSMGKFIGAAFGAAKGIIYLYLIVLLVSGISSMQNGEYPFYSSKTINQTYLFRIFYDMWR
ncbi:MAG: hypothetical protein K2H01_05500 [Ruminococcus sp.]|nr:hypothetical protein [Ruminococcus sp.]